MNLEQLAKFAVDQGATDIHLQSGATPQLRLSSLIRNVEGGVIEPDTLKAFLRTITPASIAGDLDSALARGARFSAGIEGTGRFRVSLFSHRGEPGAVLRAVPAAPKTIEELHLPAALKDVALARRGLVLIVGPASSGRSSTLAALIDLVNMSFHVHVVSIEDPVETVHSNKKALVTQMEVGRDTPSFDAGIAQAMGQDVDILVVGELADASTMRAALEAAESGKQVFAIMKGSSALNTIERLLGMAPNDQRKLIAAQLGTYLEAILVQRLANTKDGKRLPALEILRGGPLTARCILEGRFTDLANQISGRQGGMQSIDQDLVELYQAGAISGTEAMRLAHNPETLATELRGLRQAAKS